MSVKKLSSDLQSIICASTKLNNFTKAVQELAWNSLDAGATSIAIRVHIEESMIQVVDNGFGISRQNFTHLGLRYMTSKCTDLNNLKSMPDKYGYRGLSLASIIEVSKSVQIISRCECTGETWVKSFYKGKECNLSKTTTRPSKGTTIEVKGFLYNLNIQRKALKTLNEIHNIKRFLEQLSLIHCTLSISLRDDSKNEVIFKQHKNRDVYKTLHSLFGIQKDDFQELKVEKGEYKVNAYIGKEACNIGTYYWIYLNGKFIYNIGLHNMINKYLSKYSFVKVQPKKKNKTKNNIDDDDDGLFAQNSPFYFIFLSCPYYDYDLNERSKETIIEFKDWNPIKKILEKLIKLYAGDYKLHTKNDFVNKGNEQDKNIDENNTRDEVKKIMEKFLGNNSKKVGVSQMHNGIKGKVIKRKHKKKSTKSSNSKINNQVGVVAAAVEIKTNDDVNMSNCNKNTGPENAESNKNNLTKQKQISAYEIITLHNIDNGENFKQDQKKHAKKIKEKKEKFNCKIAKKIKNNPLVKKFENETEIVKQRRRILAATAKELSCKRKIRKNVFTNQTVQQSNVVINNKNYSVCQKVEEIIIHEYRPLPRKVDIDKEITETDVALIKPQKSRDLLQTILNTQSDIDQNRLAINEVPHFEPNLGDPKNQLNYNMEVSELPRSRKKHLQRKEKYITPDQPDNSITVSKHTFNSHYMQRDGVTEENYNAQLCTTYRNTFKSKVLSPKSISTHSVQHFGSDNTDHDVFLHARQNFYRNVYIENPIKNTFYKYQKPKSLLHEIQETSYTIEYTRSHENEEIVDVNNLTYINVSNHNQHNIYNKYVDNQTYSIDKNNDILHFGNTYTIIANDSERSQTMHSIFEIPNTYSSEVYPTKNAKSNNISIHTQYAIDRNLNPEDTNISNFQYSAKDNSEIENVEPLNVCETILNTNDLVEKEFEFSFKGTNNWGHDSLFGDFNSKEQEISQLCNNNPEINQDPEMLSHHFTTNEDLVLANENVNDRGHNYIELKTIDFHDLQHKHRDPNNYNINISNGKEFCFSRRPRFLPKGMSPIFANNNCRPKLMQDNNFEKDYYRNGLYDSFATDVGQKTEIFSVKIQDIKDLTTKDIEKVNNRIDKDNASLVFSGDSLKKAQVYGQVDDKFIAAKMKGKCNQTKEESEFLILFDQHAVHERIRLEKNLADYIVNEEWKSTTLDCITLKLSHEEIVYLHNYRDKFTQLGLRWTIVNNTEALVNAIPEAILGKNPRQVAKIIKAVKNLICEEINTIKTQGGCVTLYPKSIMNLVFSEACRFAVKFGDKLSREKCVELLATLSECKTPFQCAHGRPVMAVLMNIQTRKDKRDYKIKMVKVKQFGCKNKTHS